MNCHPCKSWDDNNEYFKKDANGCPGYEMSKTISSENNELLIIIDKKIAELKQDSNYGMAFDE